jgi:hypothetical protein
MERYDALGLALVEKLKIPAGQVAYNLIVAVERDNI